MSQKKKAPATTGGAQKGKAPTVSFTDPPKNGSFAQAVLGEVARDLKDSVASTGKLGIYPRLIKIKPAGGSLYHDALKDAVRKETLDLIKFHSFGADTGEGMKFDVSIANFNEDRVTDTARIIAREVNAFTDTKSKETRRIAGDLDKILKAAPVNALTTQVITARAAYDDESEGDERHLTVTVFLNLRTGRAVTFYMVEGSK